MSGGCGEGCGFCGRCESGAPFDAHCEDCGEGFYLGRWDFDVTRCESCLTKREAWAEAFEAKLAAERQTAALKSRRMVKAPFRIVAPEKKKGAA